MAKIMEMEILKTRPLDGLFKFILKMVCRNLPSLSIQKNVFNVPRNRFNNLFGLWRQRNRPRPFFFCFLK
jgi:hypothetical protein